MDLHNRVSGFSGSGLFTNDEASNSILSTIGRIIKVLVCVCVT